MNKVSNLLESIQNIALVVLLIAVGISYHPVIVDMSRMAGYEKGTILSRYIELLFVGVFGLSFFTSGPSFTKSKVIRSMIMWIMIIGVFGFTALALFNNSQVLGDIKSLLIALGSIIIGWKLNPSREFKYLLFLSFVSSVFFSGLYQVLINVGGFIIEDQYLANAKNSLGALLASASMVFLFMVYDTRVRFLRFVSIAGVVFGLLLLLVIRARMAFITTGFLILYYFYLRFRSSNFIVVAVLGLFVLFGVLFLMPSSVFDFIGASMTSGTQGEDFTSGRMDTYLEALNLFFENPFIGNINHAEHIGWVHNYPLLKLSGYGLLFSWPILVLYCIILVKALTRSYRYNDTISFFNLFLLVPYLISMAEPTFPFGPGTVIVFNFLLFGIADRDIATNTIIVAKLPYE